MADDWITPPDNHPVAPAADAGDWITPPEPAKPVSLGQETARENIKSAQRGPIEGIDIARAVGMGPVGMAEKFGYQPVAGIANYFKPGVLPSHLIPNVSDAIDKIAPGYTESIAKDPNARAIPRYTSAVTEMATNPATWVGPGSALLKGGLGLGASILGQAGEDVGGPLGQLAGGLLLPTAIGTRAARAARRPLEGEVLPPEPAGPPSPPPSPRESPTIEHEPTVRENGARLLPPEAPHALPEPARPGVGAAGTPGRGPLSDISPQAQDFVRKQLEAEGYTADPPGRSSMAQRDEAMSSHQTLAEVTPGMEANFGGLATHPGESRSIIENTLNSRAEEAPARFRALANRTIGNYQDMQDLQRSMEIERGRVATPLYDAFRRLPIPPTQALNDLIPRLEAAGAFANARRLAAVQGRPWQDVFTPESGVPQQFPTGETWDLVKRAVDTQIEESTRAGSRNWTRVYTQLKNDLIDALDNHPDQRIGEAYRQARESFATPTELLNAQQLGRDVLTDKVHREELPYLTASYSAAQMRNLRIGLRADLEDRAGRSRSPTRTTSSLLDAVLPESNQQKLRWVLGDEPADELIAGAQHEEAMHGAPGRIVYGSATGARMTAREQFALQPTWLQGVETKDIPSLSQIPTLGVKKVLEKGQDLLRRNAEAKQATLRADVARIYTLQGNERTQALQQLLGGAEETGPIAQPPEAAPPPEEGAEPLKRKVIERGRSGRPTKTEPLPIGTEQQILEKGYEKATQKVPGPSGQKNPLPVPEDYQAGLDRMDKRKGKDIGGVNNAATRLAPGIWVGDVNLGQWKQRTAKILSPDEIAEARRWYRDALPTYEKYFGPEKAPAMLGAWLMANQNVSPAGAVLNAVRPLEQYLNKTTGSLQGGLSHDKVFKWWDAIMSGDMSKLGQAGSGQKIYDFIDSALEKNTRTFYGDDPRAGAPAVADVHSLRDMGFVDNALVNWVRANHGDKAADALKIDSQHLSPGEAQYEWSANKMRAFTDQLNKQKWMGGNWTPAELQAVGWTAMSKLLGRKAETPSAGIESNIRNLSYELDFGAGAPYNEQFPEWGNLTGEQKTAVSKAVLPSIVDFAKQVAGAQETARVEGLGGWHEFTNPSYKSRLIASPEVAGDVADMIGYLAQQTKIFGYRPLGSGNRLGVSLYGEGLKDTSNVAKLWGALVERHPDFAAGFSPSVNADGVHGMEILLDKGGAKMAARIQQEMVPGLSKIADELGLGEIELRDFRAAEQSREHDWAKDPSGSGYLQRLTQRYGPDLQERLELFKREKLEPQLQQEIARASGAEGAAAGPAAEPEAQVAPAAKPLPQRGRRGPARASPHVPMRTAAPGYARGGRVPFGPVDPIARALRLAHRLAGA